MQGEPDKSKDECPSLPFPELVVSMNSSMPDLAKIRNTPDRMPDC
jgi:hypothetical protein